ncbi:hypothetical protein GT037_001779 [Alternaria burnsii]|uniref:Uncharacterized protein n=1 Tax=Alternaria burnsii TaxID=1187904 RepID=A0A8H7BEV1_9PLEO|nr:uncharacterized protein GT037_001779 [Alternaria burnsii]KAF7680128.1 hypothetical protein GT037_001779 [Alternaria burnsii]
MHMMRELNTSSCAREEKWCRSSAGSAVDVTLRPRAFGSGSIPHRQPDARSFNT